MNFQDLLEAGFTFLSFNKEKEQATPEDIAKVESAINAKLPEDYKNYLLHCNGGFIQHARKRHREDICRGMIVTWPEGSHRLLDNEHVVLEKMFECGHADQLDKLKGFYDYTLPENTLPIGEIWGDGFVLLGFGEENYGKVTYWRVEGFEPACIYTDDNEYYFATEQEVEGIACEGQVADSFAEFVRGLITAEESRKICGMVPGPYTPRPDDTPEYTALAADFFLENLPEGLLNLFVPQRAMKSPAPTPENAQILGLFWKEMDAAIKANRGGSFVRLGSCSPADIFHPSYKVKNAKAFMLLWGKSQNLLESGEWGLAHSYTPVYFVRPWIDIKPWQEFRCIVKNRRLWGISQFYRSDNPKDPRRITPVEEIAAGISDFIYNSVLPNARHNSFVCSVLYTKPELRLIDFNPLTPQTNRCLFNEIYSDEPPQPEFRFYYKDGIMIMPLEE